MDTIVKKKQKLRDITKAVDKAKIIADIKKVKLEKKEITCQKRKQKG